MRKVLFVFLIPVLFFFAVTDSCSEAAQSLIHRSITFLSDNRPVGFHFTFQIEKSPVFGDGRTDQLNRLLKHFFFDGTIDENLSELTVSLDQQDLFDISQIHLSTKESVCLSPANGDPVIIPDQAVPEEELYSLQGVSDTYLREKDIFSSLNSFRLLISRLPEEFPEKTGSVKILEKYRYYGAATKRVTVNITGEELNEFIRKNLPEYSENELFPDLSALVFENRQGFTLLFTEDHQLIGITYSGKLRLSEEDLREVRLDWKTIQSDTLEKNELTLRTPNSDRTRRNNYILDSQWSLEEDGRETFRWNAETDLLSDAVRTQNKIESEWTAADHHLSGEYTETNLSDRSHPAKTFLVDVDVSDSYEYQGTLEIIDKNDTIEASRYLIGFRVFPAISEAVSAYQPEARTVSLEEYLGIRSSLESYILYELIKLPDEDLAFIMEGLPETVWK